LITPFTLPSNPSIQVSLREATVADAIDFADVDERHEEELATLFLTRMQEGAVHDPKKWTGEDRRFALYWYWLHTAKDHDVALTYQCDHCGESHTCLQDFRKLAEAYTPIDGPAERSGNWRGEKFTVKPLTGANLEALERMKTDVDLLGKGLASMRIESLILSVAFGGKNRKETHQRIVAMSLDEFAEFAELATGMRAEMKHGLDGEYEDGRFYLLIPAHDCPAKEGAKTRLRYPFRNNDYIPGL